MHTIEPLMKHITCCIYTSNSILNSVDVFSFPLDITLPNNGYALKTALITTGKHDHKYYMYNYVYI